MSFQYVLSAFITASYEDKYFLRRFRKIIARINPAPFPYHFDKADFILCKPF